MSFSLPRVCRQGRMLGCHLCTSGRPDGLCGVGGHLRRPRGGLGCIGAGEWTCGCGGQAAHTSSRDITKLRKYQESARRFFFCAAEMALSPLSYQGDVRECHPIVVMQMALTLEDSSEIRSTTCCAACYHRSAVWPNFVFASRLTSPPSCVVGVRGSIPLIRLAVVGNVFLRNSYVYARPDSSRVRVGVRCFRWLYGSR